MKIVHIAAWDHGGAGNAAYRLHQSLMDLGLDSNFLCFNKAKPDSSVYSVINRQGKFLTQNKDLSHSPEFYQHLTRWRSFKTLPGADSNIEMFSDTHTELKLLDIPLIQEADILHFHWMSGILNYSELIDISNKKKIVWTLHDMNAFTGGCHYAGQCEKYKIQCNQCEQVGQKLAIPSSDLALNIWDLKNKVYGSSQIEVVAPSHWLAKCAQDSAHFKNMNISVIPYSLNLNIFQPMSQKSAREAFNLDVNGRYILFTSVSSNTTRKGFDYLIQALEQFPTQYQDVKVLVMGDFDSSLVHSSSLEIIPLGKISEIEKVALAYNAADVFAIPSLEDNLPNVVLESLACAIPVVGFDIGGIPDMVDHKKTGYLCSKGDVKEFIQGLTWTLENASLLKNYCRQKAEKEYRPEIQSQNYQSIYQKLIFKRMNKLDKNQTRSIEEIISALPQFLDLPTELSDLKNRLLGSKEVRKTNLMMTKSLISDYLKQLPSVELQLNSVLKIVEDKLNSIHIPNLVELDYQLAANDHANNSLENHTKTILPIKDLIRQAAPRDYKVTALVSTYASERFMRGCLEDLEAQSIAQDIEIMVINSGSPENEDAIVREFLEKYDNITYIHTEREKLYTAWNRGIKVAQGKYITNANTDDRHRYDCIEILANALDNNPECAVSYGNSIITDNVDCRFEDANILRKHEWLPFSYMNLLRKCEVGPQPMWRASVHADIGYFSDKYRVVGDYDFWLRIAEKYPLHHVPEDLGLYLTHDNNLEHQDQEGTFLESSEVKWKYIQRFVESNPLTPDELKRQLNHHLATVSQMMSEVKQNQKVSNFNLFEYHFYTLSLLKFIQGEVQEARSLCLSFFQLVGQSKNVAHLYRKLLVTPIAPRYHFQKNPLVSIIVPLYNQGIYMADTIESVINQNYTNWELIIVNDGSKDDSYEVTQKIIEKYAGRNITLLTHANQGKTFTRNRGVESCRGEYICILDSDDQIASTYLETAVKTFSENPDVGWITPWTLQFGPTVNQLQYNFKQDFVNMLTVCLAPVSAMYRKSMYDDVNGYSDMFTREDWEFWIKAGERGWQGIVTTEVEFMYRIKENRWGLKPENNRRSKTDLYNLHPWWYRDFDVATREKVFDLSTGCHLPADYLDNEAIAIYQGAPKNSRQDVIQALEQIKARFYSVNPNFEIRKSTSESQSLMK